MEDSPTTETKTEPQKLSRFWLGVGALVVSAAVFIAAAAFYLFWAVRTPLSVKDAERGAFIVSRGEGARDIGENLFRQGYVRSARLFEYYAHIIGASGKLQAGEYRVGRDMDIPQLVVLFTSGAVVQDEVAATFPEGFSSRQMEDVLIEKGLVKKGEFLRIVTSPPTDLVRRFSHLSDKPETASLEGYLFPDTYRFRKSSLPGDILEKLLTVFDKRLSERIRTDIVSGKRTIFETVTMASLIEKEVPEPNDRRVISGILWKRIELGMPLQVDATIAFITGKKTGEILYADLEVKSPYNTYLNRGLPPGPIANPGIDAIEAASRPQKSEYLYYLSKPTGETVFSRTLEEHNIAKAR